MPLRAIDSASPVMEQDLQQNRCASGVFAMEGIPVLADQPLSMSLREHPFARNLDLLHIDSLAQCSRECTIAAGDYLWRQGGHADFFYLICSGRAALEIAIPHEGIMQIENVGEGEVLGWYWLLPSCRWNVDARAITPVQALRVDGKLLRQKCEMDSSFHQSVLEKFALVITQRLLTMQAQLIHAGS
jgi:CRP/FNR family transcriptional regulator, cyclic AMP receptor protein